MRVKMIGLGGQGIAFASIVLGYAAVLDGKYATQVSSYGAEVRGTSIISDVIISEKPVKFPFLKEADILYCMNADLLAKWINCLTPNGVIVLNARKPVETSRKLLWIDSDSLSLKHFGSTSFSNIILLGFMNKALNIVSQKSLKKAIEERETKVKENVRALELGASQYKL